MALDNAKNFAKVTVSTGYDASATSIVLSAGHGLKLPIAPFNLTWWNVTDYPDPSDDPNVEIVRCTAVATDTLTVTRGQESISASTKNTSGKTYKMVAALTAKVVNSDLSATYLTSLLPIVLGSNLVELRNGTSGQQLSIFGTYSSGGANLERLAISFPPGGPITFASDAAGTGTARGIQFTGSVPFTVYTPGPFTFGITTPFRIYDSYGGNGDIPAGSLIGSAGATSNFSFFPDVTGVTTGVKMVFGYWNGGGRSAVEVANVASGDGTLLLMKSGGLVAVGGLTSSFPALKRSSAILQGRLADDSAFCQIQGKLTTDANATTGLTAGVLAATTNATITITDASGQVYRVPVII